MKKFLSVFTALSMAVAFVGCESETTTTEPAVETPADGDADVIEEGAEGTDPATADPAAAPAGDAAAEAPATE